MSLAMRITAPRVSNLGRRCVTGTAKLSRPSLTRQSLDELASMKRQTTWLRPRISNVPGDYLPVCPDHLMHRRSMPLTCPRHPYESCRATRQIHRLGSHLWSRRSKWSRPKKTGMDGFRTVQAPICRGIPENAANLRRNAGHRLAP